MLASLTCGAITPVEGSAITAVEGQFNVAMRLDLVAAEVRSNELLIATPMLVNGVDTLRLAPVAVMGRNRYIRYTRGDKTEVPEGAAVVRVSDIKGGYDYASTALYEPRYEGAELQLGLRRYGCAGCNVGSPETVRGIAEWTSPKAGLMAGDLVYVSPLVKGGPKERSVEYRANIVFPVNRTELKDNLYDNYNELNKITRSIDSIRSDKDVTLGTIRIKGYASPEGHYTNNERLAKGRTEAVRRYVDQLYTFPAGQITAEYQPEDWEGLIAWVEKSNLSNRESILSIARDSTLSPDARDMAIWRDYPEQYALLLNTVYPTLRHTDYRISYTVRSYTDPVEILTVMQTRPGNISLDEYYLAASTLPVDSPEYNAVFTTAANVYPTDPIANLNAGNASLSAGDLSAAAGYLAKAGDSPEAVYARGLLAMLEKDYSRSRELLVQALNEGVEAAAPVIERIDKVLAVKK